MTYDSSFAGAGFDTLAGSPGSAGATTNIPRTLTANVNVRKMPGGAGVYIDVGGVGATELVLTCFFTNPSDYAALEAQVGNTGTLSYFDGAYSAVLSALKRTYLGLGASPPCAGEATFYRQ
jgi:hypothetical protein